MRRILAPTAQIGAATGSSSGSIRAGIESSGTWTGAAIASTVVWIAPPSVLRRQIVTWRRGASTAAVIASTRVWIGAVRARTDTSTVAATESSGGSIAAAE